MKVTLTTNSVNRVSINNQQRSTIRTVGLGSAGSGATSLNELSDVATGTVENNEALVYDETTGKFVSKTIPEVDGGDF